MFKKIDKYFTSTKTNTSFGVELEMVLYDEMNKELLSDIDLLHDVLSHFDKHIYKDYYTWQLEIKTKPHNDIRKCLSEIKSLVRKAEKRFKSEDISVIPIPYINGNQRTYCGMHMHFSFPSLKVNDFWKKAVGIYTMLFPILEYSRNCPNNHIGTNERLVNSRHIQMPELDRYRFVGNTAKRYDMIYSHSDNGHHQKKLRKPDTVEIRIFDTPSYFDVLRYIIRGTVNIARYMKLDNPTSSSLNSNLEDTYYSLLSTRNQLCNNISSKHSYLNITNQSLNKNICKRFKVRPPEDKQTNLRTKNKITRLNKYRTLLDEGKWLD